MHPITPSLASLAILPPTRPSKTQSGVMASHAIRLKNIFLCPTYSTAKVFGRLWVCSGVRCDMLSHLVPSGLHTAAPVPWHYGRCCLLAASWRECRDALCPGWFMQRCNDFMLLTVYVQPYGRCWWCLHSLNLANISCVFGILTKRRHS